MGLWTFIFHRTHVNYLPAATPSSFLPATVQNHLLNPIYNMYFSYFNGQFWCVDGLFLACAKNSICYGVIIYCLSILSLARIHICQVIIAGYYIWMFLSQYPFSYFQSFPIQLSGESNKTSLISLRKPIT